MAFSVVLFDACEARNHLLPLVATRPIGNLRVGILTINQKWEVIFKTTVSYSTAAHLSTKFPLLVTEGVDVLVINGGCLPSDNLIVALEELKVNQQLVAPSGEWIAVKVKDITHFDPDNMALKEEVFFDAPLVVVKYPENIFTYNGDQIAYDLHVMQVESVHNKYSMDNEFIGENIFIEEGVVMRRVILDSSKGPIFIGEGAIIEPGVIIYGPAAIGEKCRLKSGALIYSNVTIGVSTTICGELSNVVIWGNSAKGHAGYLGCAVLGEGCNLGAGTTNSNLKNDWSTVKLYHYSDRSYRDTQLSKCGVIIGDQVMLGIQSMITTGTVIGTGAQVAMSKFIPKFVPDFSWFTDAKLDVYDFDRFVKMMQRKATLKNEVLADADLQILAYVYLHTQEKKNNNQH